MARLPHQSAPFLYGVLQLAITTRGRDRYRRLSIGALGSRGAGALGRSMGRRLVVDAAHRARDLSAAAPARGRYHAREPRVMSRIDAKSLGAHSRRRRGGHRKRP
jgi:hypothetical protein